MRRVLLLSVLLGGCYDHHLLQCNNGEFCPVGLVCDEAHNGCVDPGQLSACANAEPFAECTASALIGKCFDGVCLLAGCGNGFVEPGEQCDDGNQRSGDGCRDDCRSTEVCGNGEIDRGEECDDGNRMSRDGCDSLCSRETAQWRVVVPSVEDLTYSTPYDENRKRLVTFGSTSYGQSGMSVTGWEFDGVSWTAIPGPPGTVGSLYWDAGYYDPVRQAIVWVTSGVAPLNGFPSTPAHASAWDGSTWTSLTPSSTLYSQAGGATFDRVRQQPIVVLISGINSQANTANVDAYTFDSTGAWQMMTRLSTQNLNMRGAAWDPEAGKVVVLGALYSDSTMREWVYDGSWSTSSMTTLPTSGVISYGIINGRLDALIEMSSGALQMWQRNGGVWMHVAADDPPLTTAYPPGFYFDDARNALVVTSGVENDVKIMGAWQRDAPPRAISASLLTDPLGHLLILGADVASTFRLWRVVDSQLVPYAASSFPPIRYGESIINALGRRATLLYGGTVYPGGCLTCSAFDDVYSFDGLAWQRVAAGQGPLYFVQNPSLGVGYDPAGRRMLSTKPNDTKLWALPDDNNQWMRTDIDVPATTSALEWDSRNNLLVLSTTSSSFTSPGVSDGDLYEYRDGAFRKAVLAPSGRFRPVTDLRTGNLMWIASALQAPGQMFTHAVWERHGLTWSEYDPLPIDLDISSTAYSPSDGRLAVMGKHINATVVLVREWLSNAPLETCELGVDADGDGMPGCSDPDCFWKCSGCPPYTTCRFDLPD